MTGVWKHSWVYKPCAKWVRAIAPMLSLVCACRVRAFSVSTAARQGSSPWLFGLEWDYLSSNSEPRYPPLYSWVNRAKLDKARLARRNGLNEEDSGISHPCAWMPPKGRKDGVTQCVTEGGRAYRRAPRGFAKLSFGSPGRLVTAQPAAPRGGAHPRGVNALGSDFDFCFPPTHPVCMYLRTMCWYVCM